MAVETVADEATYQRNISRIVRIMMTRDGLSQTELGEHLGLKQTNVSGRLRGGIPWTIRDLVRLGAVFHEHPVLFLIADPKAFRPPNLIDALTRAEAEDLDAQNPYTNDYWGRRKHAA